MSFFAPHRGCSAAAGDAARVVCRMVKALHAAGIEVVIDVVYNHTAEGGAGGPDLQLQGARQQHVLPERRSPAATPNFSGCGNSLNANNRYVRKMILDACATGSRRWTSTGFAVRSPRRCAAAKTARSTSTIRRS